MSNTDAKEDNHEPELIEELVEVLKQAEEVLSYCDDDEGDTTVADVRHEIALALAKAKGGSVKKYEKSPRSDSGQEKGAAPELLTALERVEAMARIGYSHTDIATVCGEAIVRHRIARALARTKRET